MRYTHDGLRKATLLAVCAGTMAAIASAIPAAATGGEPPVFPGAVPAKTTPGSHPMCGHRLSVVASYKAPRGASERTVMAWYHRMMPGGTIVDDSADSGGAMSTGEIFGTDTEWGVTVIQMKPDPSVGNAYRTLGMDVAQIGFVRFDPPLGSGMIALIATAAGTGKGAAEAKAALGKMCPRA